MSPNICFFQKKSVRKVLVVVSNVSLIISNKITFKMFYQITNKNYGSYAEDDINEAPLTLSDLPRENQLM